MKKPALNPILDAIDRVVQGSAKCQMEPKMLRVIKPDLSILARYLKATQNQAFFFALIATDNLAGNAPDVGDFCRHLDASPMVVMKYLSDLEGLVEKRLVSSRAGRRNSELLSDRIYTTHQEVLYAILHRQPLPSLPKINVLTPLDALAMLYDLLCKLNNGDLSRFVFLQRFEEQTKKCRKFTLIDELEALELSSNERGVLYYVLWKCIMGSKSVSVEELIRSLQGTSAATANFIQSLQSGRNTLISMELLETHEGRFLNEIELGVAQSLRYLLKEQGIDLRGEANKNELIVSPQQITPKTLFYNEQEEDQMRSVFSALEEPNFRALKSRLEEKHLPLSMNILLYGAPGTGKTESVYQLARHSGREILKVDISQTKSMWFGESEKSIKRVFSEYENYLKTASKTPILFFNEADAILGTRGVLSTSNARQTENAIQNILLEELENFKGIFIATTNLVQNLDAAFERRFLFKVKFAQPSETSRKLIWLEKMPHLYEEDARHLGAMFSLSGGQIENVVRKCQIADVLSGQQPDVAQIIAFCQQEQLSKENAKSKIGFTLN
jgi:hypothetical protein